MIAAKRYESVWNAFLKELPRNPTITLSSVQEKWHTNGAPDKPRGRAVQMLTQKHVAKRYMIAKKVVPLHYESEWQYKYV